MPESGRHQEHGNIFFTLFGAVALVGVIGAATTTLMRGPLSTMSTINARTKADTQMQIASKLAMIAASQQASSGNCDADPFVEPVPPAAATPSPVGGGGLPPTIGSAQNDPWGTQYGYCVWDLGVQTGDAGCGGPGVRLVGGDNSLQPVMVILSAGPDRAFQTSCEDWADNTGTPAASPPSNSATLVNKPAGSDDIIVSFTYDEALTAADGLWAVKSADPNTITTAKNVEFASGTTTTFQGTATFDPFSELNLSAASKFMIPTTATPPACNLASDAALIIDTSSGSNVLSICSEVTPGVWGWDPIGGGGTTVNELDDLDDAVSDSTDDVLFLGSGAGALYTSASGGTNNIGVGLDALGGLTSGDQNIVIGNNAASSLTTGTGNIIIGHGVDAAAAASNTLQIGEMIYGTGMYSSAGQIGIGDVPSTTLDVAGTAEANKFQFDNNTHITGAGGVLALATGNTTRVTINNTGLGIGLVPDASLDVNGDAEVTGDVSADRFLAYASGSNSSNPAFTFAGDTNTGMFHAGSDQIGFTLGGTEEATLTATAWTVSGSGIFAGEVRGDSFDFNGSTNSGLFYASGLGVNLNVNGSTSLFADTAGNIGIGLPSPAVKLDVGGPIRVGTTVAACGASLYGAMRYSSGDILSICSSVTGDWETIGTSGGGGGGGGSLWTNNTTYITRGSAHVIDNAIPLSPALEGAGTRLVWYPNKSVLRAGSVSGSQWDDANTGNNSVAFGSDTTASGNYSFSAGSSNIAAGASSVAIGNQATASQANSFAFGLGSTAGVAPAVAGARSLGIFMGDQGGVSVAATNTMGLFGGKLVIDPATPATQLSARGVIDIGAATDAIVLPLGTTAQRPGSPVNGMLRYNDDNGKFEAYQAGTWQDILTGAATMNAAGPDRAIQFKSGSGFAGDASFVFSSAGWVGIGTGAPQAELDIAGSGAFIPPRGDAAGRPASPVNGMLRYNSASGKFEGYQAGAWGDLVTNAASGTAALSSITAAAAVNTINNLNFAQTWNWSTLSTQTAMLMNANAITSGKVIGLASSSTGFTGTMLDVALSGNNGANTGSLIKTTVTGGSSAAVPLMVTNGGSGLSLRVNDDGTDSDSTPVAVDATGQLVIGAATARASLDVNGGDFIVSGTYTGTASVPATGAGARMFYDVQKGAFRAGQVGGTEWDNANIGNASIATGRDTIASGDYSIAIGDMVHASGNDSIAMGNHVTAGNGVAGSGFGDGSAAIGLIDDGTVNITTPPQVTGSQSLGIFMDDQDGIVFSSSNTIGVFGGSLVIDPSVPSTQLSARGVLDIGAATDAIVLPLGTTAQRPGSPVNGMMRYNDDNGKFEAYQAGTWQDILTGAASTSAPDRSIQFASGNSFTGEADFVYSPAGWVGLGTGTPEAELDIAGTGAFLPPRGSMAQRPAAPVDGMFRYNSGSGKFEGYQAGAWGDLVTSSVEAAGGDREIQFNSSGALAASSTYKLMADGDLLLTGTYTGVASVPVTGAGTRMFFDTQKAAFRAGYINGTQWDDANIGNYSVALGGDITAKNSYTLATGRGTTASGWNSTAIGNFSVASATDSIALGRNVTAGNGVVSSGLGDGSMALGLSDDAVLISTNSQVTGIQSFGIFMGDQDGLVVSANNQMSLLGGKLVIDPAVPATNLTADTALEVTGTLKIGDGGEACDASTAGGIRYSGGAVQFCNGTAWANINAGGSSALSSITAASAINTIDSLNFAQTWNWSTLSTQTAMLMNANAITSGKVLNIASSATGFTGSLVDLTLSGSNAANTGSVLALNNTGTLNTGTTLLIQHNATGTNNLALRINDVAADTTPFVVDGAGNVGIGVAAPGYNLAFDGDTAAQTIGMSREATAATAGRDLSVSSGGAVSGGSNLAGGNLNLYSGVSTGSGTSDVVFYGYNGSAGTATTDNTAAEVLRITGKGSLKLAGGTDTCAAGITGGIRYSGGAVQFCNGTAWANVSAGATAALSALTAASAINTIDSLNFAQTWNWSTLSTQTAMLMNANAITSGKVLNIASSATGFTGSMVDLTLSGSNAANTGSILALNNTGVANTNTTLLIQHNATGTNNLALRINDVAADTTPFVVDGAGNVAIGAATARAALDVATTDAIVLPVGTTAQQPGSPANGMIRYNTTTSKFEGRQSGVWTSFVTGLSTVNFKDLLDVPSSYAGSAGKLIRVTAAETGLEFTDAIIPVVTGEPAPAAFAAAGSTTQVQFNDAGVFAGDTALLWNKTSNYLGIGVTPSVALDVSGDIEYTGTITDVSDIRLKKDIHKLSDRGRMLDKIGQVDTYSFVMKDDKRNQVEFGVMAQEIQKIFPELVRTDMTTPEHYMSVNYVGMIAPLIEASKELKAENDDLKVRIANLEKDMQGMKAYTGYGINKAMIGFGMIMMFIFAGATGFTLLTFMRRIGNCTRKAE